MPERPELRSGQPLSAETVRASVPWHRDRVLVFTMLAVLAVDQLSKYLVRRHLPLYESWPDEGLVRLTHGTNSGSAFGLFPDQTLVLIVASIIAIAFLFFYYRTHALPRRLLRFAIGLQIGGAFGNLIDRLTDGTVVDFIDLGRWPIFNLADSSIVVGISLLLGVILFGGSGSPSTTTPDSDGSRGSNGVNQ